jgi:hypothetical protein
MDGRKHSQLPLRILSARALRSLLAVACVLYVGLPVDALSSAINIAGDAAGVTPSDFDLHTGKWIVVSDVTAHAGRAIEQSGKQTTEFGFPLAIYQPDSPKNTEISLRIKAIGGKSDQDGGVALRLKGPGDYYLVELDTMRDTVRLSRVSHGTADEIISVDANLSSDNWHTLTVRAVNDKFTVSLDGAWIFTGVDASLPDAGRIALWTKGDSIVRFADIAVAPLPVPSETD